MMSQERLIIEPIPAFADNYIWLLHEPPATSAVAVDPGDAAPLLAALDARGLTLTAVLITHHPRDHIGGLAALVGAFPELAILAPDDARIAQATRRVAEGDCLAVPGLNSSFEVLAVPGHTATHVAYLGEGALFCGDTLFTAGCGRVFDGTSAQLATSLRRLAALPPATRCYCAHEYTEDNLGFALWVEPDNPALAARLAATRQRRAADLPTVPATLASELATNPFLRCAEPAVIAAAEAHAGVPLSDATAVFATLRDWKDREYD